MKVRPEQVAGQLPAAAPAAGARTVLVAAPLGHPLAQSTALTALAEGGTVITVPEATPAHLAAALARNPDTVVIIGSDTARHLLLHRSPTRAPSVKQLWSADSPWPVGLTNAALAVLSNATLTESLHSGDGTLLATRTSMPGQFPSPTGP